jgi:23S rRNA pseudouridine2605 synthase
MKRPGKENRKYEKPSSKEGREDKPLRSKKKYGEDKSKKYSDKKYSDKSDKKDFRKSGESGDDKKSSGESRYGNFKVERKGEKKPSSSRSSSYKSTPEESKSTSRESKRETRGKYDSSGPRSEKTSSSRSASYKSKSGESKSPSSGSKSGIKKSDSPKRPRSIKASSPSVSETPAGNDALIRLNKYIADAGICSRREADQLIEQGEITVNGEVVTTMGYKVSRGDEVKYQGRRLVAEKLVYVLLNKPKDFITTTDDPEKRRTVMELIKNACDERIYPVGRLDRNTTGLLLFTNDGELAKVLSHPSGNVKKIYKVELDKPLTKEDFSKIEEGVELEDGVAKVDEIAALADDKSVIGVELHIGKNRIVRRIFESLGYEVVRLDRVVYAGLDKQRLPRGKWRFLTDREISRLKRFQR